MTGIIKREKQFIQTGRPENKVKLSRYRPGQALGVPRG
jgi:hypothetical protein